MSSTTRRGASTRDALLVAAEELFAEQGIRAVSNRQIGEFAGQGNNTAVSYHFGTREDLLRAIVRRHQSHTESIRTTMVERLDGSAGLRDWVECLVLPSARHLESLPAPTWFARFNAQLMTDPGLRTILEQEPAEAPSLHEVLRQLDSRRPASMPGVVRAERDEMTRQLLVHLYAQRERQVADGKVPPARASWGDAARGLVDAITGMWLAPWTRVDEPTS